MSEPLHWTGEWDAEVRSRDPLAYPGYAERLATGAQDAVRTGPATVGGVPVAGIELSFEHFSGTLGVVAGERITRALRRAAERRLPAVSVVSTGGARLQEGMVALVQMARTVAAARDHAAAGLLSLAVLAHPSTGGVYASWPAVADLRVGVRGAAAGFAGRRVAEAVTGRTLDAESHTVERALAHGWVDAVRETANVSGWLAAALGAVDAPLPLPEGRPRIGAPLPPPLSGAPMDLVRAARRPQRPSGLEWAAAVCTSWTELAGTDPAIRAGLATMAGRRVGVVVMDRHARGDAAAHPGPSAYRTAERLVRLCDRLELPVVTFVDTPGADPSETAEAGGVAYAIAACLAAFHELRSPSVAVCVGEGGSGGALALSLTDRVLMLEDAVFSVIGPELASVILHGSAASAELEASRLRLTSRDNLALGTVDALLPGAAAPGALDALLGSVLLSLSQAEPGDRHRRLDRASQRWLIS